MPAERQHSSPTGRSRDVVLIGALFFLSGAAALVYQVAWQRILALHSGVGLYSVAMIVAAFMAGLGFGSHLGGLASERISTAKALRLFAFLELGIGLFGAVSPFLYYDWLYPFASRLPSPSWRGGLLHFLALIPPTTLMGMSLPFLVRAMVREVSIAGRTIGYLYGINMLGAAFGAFAAPWVLIPSAGITGAVQAAAAANCVVGFGALVMGFSARGRVEETPAAPVIETGGREVELAGRHPFGLWLALYGLSGFVALSLEVLWFRLVDVAVKSTAFTFGTVLALYLLGSSAGCLLAVRYVRRLRRPLFVFLLCQCAILVLAGLAVIVLVRLPVETPLYEWFFEYWGTYRFFRFGRSLDWVYVTRLYLLLPLFLFGLPTALMGFSFPVLQRAVHDEVRTSGRKVGALQAANIAGCVAGSLLIGLLALQLLGTSWSLRLLPAVGLVFAAVGWRYYGRLFAWPMAALLGAILAVPDHDILWRRLHGVTPEEEHALFEEDATGVVAVAPRGAGWRMAVNGKGNSWFPYGGVHTVLGALPAVIHSAPLDVAVIGLASGDTAWAAGCRPETRSLTIFEISSPQPRILRRLAARESFPELTTLLGDPRVRFRLEDGRHALEADTSAYDLLEADAIRPEVAYSGNLYSLEFFALCARRLRTGGVMCTWAPTPRVRETFRRVFPHVLESDAGAILIGSREPLAVDLEAWQRRLAAATGYLGENRARTVADRLSHCVPAIGPPANIQPNRDLFPRDEFALSSSSGSSPGER